MREKKYAYKYALYVAANRLANYEHNDYSLAIFILGDVIYDELLKNKSIIQYQEYLFPLSWQIFLDSLITDSYKTILIDSVIISTAIFLSGKHEI